MREINDDNQWLERELASAWAGTGTGDREETGVGEGIVLVKYNLKREIMLHGELERRSATCTVNI